MFGRAKVYAEQSAISINNNDERNVWEVVPLGQHLCAHQYAGAAAVHCLENTLNAAFALSAVPIDPHDGDVRKLCCQYIFTSFSALADWLE